MSSMNIPNNWSRPTQTFRQGESPADKVRARFAPQTEPTTLADLSQGLEKLSPREQDAAKSGQQVYHKVKSHFEALSKADNRSSLAENPRDGHYTSSPSPRHVPTFSTVERWSEVEGQQRTVVLGSVKDEGTQAVTILGQERMAVATTYRNENASQEVPGGMYFYTDGELERAGMIDSQGKRIEVVASSHGDLLTVMESYNPRV